MWNARRRAVVVIAAMLAATSCGDIACGIGADRHLRLAAGPPDSAAACVAGAFVSGLDAERPDFHAGLLSTGGSTDSLAALRDGRAELAIASGDVLAQAVNGEGPFEEGTVSARTIATLYTNRLYLIVPAASEINGLSGLRDRIVGVGPAGSGMDLTLKRALEAALIERRVTVEPHAWPDLVAALDRRSVGAIAWLDGLPSPDILAAAKDGRRTLRFLNAGSVVPLLDRRYGTPLYERVEILPAAYGTADPVDTVGVSAVLVAREDLDETIAFEVTRVLFRSSRALPRACAAVSALSRATAARAQAAALHKGAARFYQQP